MIVAELKKSDRCNYNAYCKAVLENFSTVVVSSDEVYFYLPSHVKKQNFLVLGRRLLYCEHVTVRCDVMEFRWVGTYLLQRRTRSANSFQILYNFLISRFNTLCKPPQWIQKDNVRDNFSGSPYDCFLISTFVGYLKQNPIDNQ